MIQSAEKERPFPVHADVSQHFGVALQDAVRGSVRSMEELHRCLTPCVGFLRSSGLGPVEMILSIKACAREHAKRSQALGDEFAIANTSLLIEQIVKWAIVEYYRSD